MNHLDFSHDQFLRACLTQKSLLHEKKVYINFISKFSVHGATSLNSLTYQSSAGGTLNPRENIHFFPKCQQNRRGISVFVDDYISKIAQYSFTRSDFNVALLSESKSIKDVHYEALRQHHHYFDLILTYDKEVLACYPEKSRFVPADTISVDKQSFGLNLDKKVSPLSYIYSSKRQTLAHNFRHRVADFLNSEFPDFAHLFGTGVGKRIDYKHIALQNYMFSISIENSSYDYYFTEKILDCFITGTIPIYYGTKSVSSFFDPRGILFFDSLDELKQILSDISSNPHAFYYGLLKYVHINYLLASQYLCLDDSFVFVILNHLHDIGRYDELEPFLFDPQDTLNDFTFKYS